MNATYPKSPSPRTAWTPQAALVLATAMGGALACQAQPDAPPAASTSPARARTGGTPETPDRPTPDRATPTVGSDRGDPGAVHIDHTVSDIDGNPVQLSDYRGKVMLIVNTASECGYTPQYADLEALYRAYRDRGLMVLAFPSNDFGGQEPGDATEIKSFTEENFDITFPLFAKLHARGADKAPLYRALTEETPPGIRGEVRWNFTKFLVDPAGRVVRRFESATRPTDPAIRSAIETLLASR